MTKKLKVGECVDLNGKAFVVVKVIGDMRACIKPFGSPPSTKTLDVSPYADLRRLEDKEMTQTATTTTTDHRNAAVFNKFSSCSVYRWMGEETDATPAEGFQVMRLLGVETARNAANNIYSGAKKGFIPELNKTETKKIVTLLKRVRKTVVAKDKATS